MIFDYPTYRFPAGRELSERERLGYSDLTPQQAAVARDALSTLSKEANDGGAVIVSFLLLVIGYAFVQLMVWIVGKRGDLAIDARHPLITAGVAGICLLLGWIFFKLRERRRDMYAYMELSAAASTSWAAWVRTDADLSNLGTLVTLLGSVYIAVRAFDNFSKFYEEQDKKVVAKALRERTFRPEDEIGG